MQDLKSYQVRLLQSVVADDPRDAVQRYIENANGIGLRNFYYRVEDEATGEVWMINISAAHPLLTADEFVELYSELGQPEDDEGDDHDVLDEDDAARDDGYDDFGKYDVLDEDDASEEDDSDDYWQDDLEDPLYRAAVAAGFSGDVTEKIVGADAALRERGLQALTFEVSLGWACNHSQPILFVRYELKSRTPGQRRTSIRFHLHFRSGDKLLASQGFSVYEDCWDRDFSCAIYDDSITVLNMDSYDLPLTKIEMVADPRGDASL